MRFRLIGVLLFCFFFSLDATELKRSDWNLMSVCQDINHSDINMTDIQEIQAQNGQTIYTGEYAGYSNLETLVAGYGYWVKGTVGSNFDGGANKDAIVQPLSREGWNLMAACEDISVEDINMTDIQEIQNQAGKSLYTGEFARYSDLEILLNGYGHWVKGVQGADFVSKMGLTLPRGFTHSVIDTGGVAIETTYDSYRIVLYADYNETADSQSNHIGIFVRIDGVDINNTLHIQGTYLNQSIVVAVYDAQNRLIGVTESMLIEGNRIIDVITIDGDEDEVIVVDPPEDHNESDDNSTVDTNITLQTYATPLDIGSYQLEQLSDSEFNALSFNHQIIVADKLLSSLYFGMPYLELKALIESGSFISTIRADLGKSLNNVDEVESYIVDTDYFYLPIHNQTGEVPLVNSNAIAQHRLFAYEYLDKNFLEHWMTFVLAQTIMYSPASELSSCTLDSVMPLYNRLYGHIKGDYSIRYLTKEHMTSLNNWRRFRSPEDNGREMLEIFLLDFNDSHVPIAATALQNWSLNDDRELIIGTNENTTPQQLWGRSFTNGYGFYEALVLSPDFISTVTQRLVNIYFSTFSDLDKASVVDQIVQSRPENWKDIFLQILFSKAYLYETDRIKTFDELFYSLAKKIHFSHDTHTFELINRRRPEMHQSLMTYKLGLPVSVPVDTSSFGIYREFIYEEMLLKEKVDPDDYGWGKNGWVAEKLLDEALYEGVPEEESENRARKYLNYLFLSTVSREPTQAEWNYFYGRMEATDNWFGAGGSESTQIILDYISRLSELYQFQKVQ